ncbi:MAG: TolC family protein [Thiobacillus sp.]
MGTPRTLSLAVLSALWLGGCASFSPDGGLSQIQSTARPHLAQDIVWPRDEAGRAEVQAHVAALLAQTLSADDAVQLALLNNPGLQAGFHALGIAEAERVAALRLPNPGISIGRLRRGSEVEWERSLHLSLAALLTMPMRADIESRQLEQAQRALVLVALKLAADTRKAWVMAVAANQSLAYQKQSLDAAEAGAELGRRMVAAGNWSVLRQAREQSFQADASLAMARAEQAQHTARERLIRLLGLHDDSQLRLPERLPDLPAALPSLPDIEQQAMASRIDLMLARQQTDTLARHLGLTRRTRFINVLELGAMNNRSNESPTQRGYEISFELPLFDWGQSRVAAAQSRYWQALEQARDVAVNARSEVREAQAARQSRFAIARHLADEVVPLKQRVSQEVLLRYNGMLASVFELLADARAQIAAVNSSLEAQRDFWLADADLQMVLAGKPSPFAPSSTLSSPADTAAEH